MFESDKNKERQLIIHFSFNNIDFLHFLDGSLDPIFQHFIDDLFALVTLTVAFVPHCIKVCLLTENILIFFKRSTFSLIPVI